MTTTPDPSQTPTPTPTTSRALVLGGGGSTGNAWVVGVLAGLAEAGLDATSADRTVGTSSGATAAAQVAATDPTELLADVLAATPPPQRPAPGPGPVVDHLSRTGANNAASADAADMRRRIGAAAVALAEADGSFSPRWRGVVAARLPSPRWPDRALLLTAVDAGTGEPVVLDRGSGVGLVDAVAASCAGGPAYRVGERWLVDGGYRRNENADLAAGCARVLVLSPFGGRTRHPLAWGLQLAAQVDELRAGGSRVEVLAPEADAAHLFGATSMDLSLRSAAARAGHQQGVVAAGRLAAFWA